MIRMNVQAFLELQGDISDAEFARKLGVSRSQLWRIRTEKSAVGEDFIEKFMLCYPDKSVNEYFFAKTVPETAQEVTCGTRRGNFFAKTVLPTARKHSGGTAGKRGESP